MIWGIRNVWEENKSKVIIVLSNSDSYASSCEDNFIILLYYLLTYCFSLFSSGLRVLCDMCGSQGTGQSIG